MLVYRVEHPIRKCGPYNIEFTPEEIEAQKRFEPCPKDVQALLDWAASLGWAHTNRQHPEPEDEGYQEPGAPHLDWRLQSREQYHYKFAFISTSALKSWFKGYFNDFRRFGFELFELETKIVWKDRFGQCSYNPKAAVVKKHSTFDKKLFP